MFIAKSLVALALIAFGAAAGMSYADATAYNRCDVYSNAESTSYWYECSTDKSSVPVAQYADYQTNR